MGVKIFRKDSWSRIKSGAISRRDIMGMDPDRDRELIGYLIAHAPEQARGSMMKYAAKEYGMSMRGHTLVWHNQTPKWFFHERYNEMFPLAGRETILARLESYIH